MASTLVTERLLPLRSLGVLFGSLSQSGMTPIIRIPPSPREKQPRGTLGVPRDSPPKGEAERGILLFAQSLPFSVVGLGTSGSVCWSESGGAYAKRSHHTAGILATCAHRSSTSYDNNAGRQLLSHEVRVLNGS